MKATFSCRACGSDAGTMILDLGIQPLANNVLRPEDLGKPEPKFPLRLFLCPACWLLQIADVVPPVTLFSEYVYFSSFSDGMVAHARKAAARYIPEFNLGSESFVIEIASNDGYLLQHFHAAGIPCLGIEPAANIAAVAQAKGISTRVEFFGGACAERLVAEGQKADLILGNNVFAHAPEINDFIAGLTRTLKADGSVILEFPHGVEMLEKTEFDTIYHEHVFYFTLTALQPLFQKHGLTIYDVEHLPLHGGSLRVFAGHTPNVNLKPSVTALLEEETRKGVKSKVFYDGFAADVLAIRAGLRSTLELLRAQGKSIGAYGASAKGSTLLNFCGLGNDCISFVADRSTYKHGRLTPGTHIPIVPAEELLTRRPGYALLLTWNFAEEILRQQRAYRDQGGHFIIPVPKVAIV